MVAPIRPVTDEQFDAYIRLPENVDKQFELIGGEIAEVVSSNRSSGMAARFIRYLLAYVDDHNLGFVTAPDGGYMVAGERYIPDVAYNSFAQQSKLTDDAYYPYSPELAIEIMSPTDNERQILIKVGNYLAAGTTVWVVYPDEEAVYIYTPGEKVQILGKEDTLGGGDIIPGFTLELSKRAIMLLILSR